MYGAGVSPNGKTMFQENWSGTLKVETGDTSTGCCSHRPISFFSRKESRLQRKKTVSLGYEPAMHKKKNVTIIAILHCTYTIAIGIKDTAKMTQFEYIMRTQ
jgi:hypothetical protein